MSSINKKVVTTTYNGAKAVSISALEELTRAVYTSFLWESSFYENGGDMATRISALLPKVKINDLYTLIIEARQDFHLRHMPLFLIAEIFRLEIDRSKASISMKDLITKVILRPDDATELLALYWRDNANAPIPSQMKKGLALSLTKFSEYQLAKYQNSGAIKLRDLFNLVHPKPLNKDQDLMFETLMNGGLATPDTWEARLSAEGNKKEIWEEFLAEKKLGGLAFLRNLRNMLIVGVSASLIKEAMKTVNFSKVLPFRFIAAARFAPMLESALETVMFQGIKEWGVLKGKTVLLLDVSGSMDHSLSTQSDMSRLEAATALAMMLREVCEDVEIYTFSNQVVNIPDRRGFALRDAVVNSQVHSNTYLGAAVQYINNFKSKADRLIVFTDEQSNDKVPDSTIEKSYMINVAGYEKSVATNKWISISGFSEKIVDFIQMTEQL